MGRVSPLASTGLGFFCVSWRRSQQLRLDAALLEEFSTAGGVDYSVNTVDLSDTTDNAVLLKDIQVSGETDGGHEGRVAAGGEAQGS